MSGPVRVVGLDLSLTSTGMSDGLSSAQAATGPSIALEARLDYLLTSVSCFVAGSSHWPVPATLVVAEDAAFAGRGQGREELAMVRGLVRHRLWRIGIPVALVRPTTLKKYTTGVGNATKTDMVQVIADLYGVPFADVPVGRGRYDMADAFALATMGYHRLGRDVPTAAGPRRTAPRSPESLDSVTWPDTPADN